MSEGDKSESDIIDRANTILKRVDLSWKDLDGKDILDGGSGGAALAHAAKLTGSTAKIYSVDIRPQKDWVLLPGEVKGRAVQGDVVELPFPDNSFDLIINCGAMDASSIQDEARILRPGGQIRITPIGGQTLDMWNVGYYLQVMKGWPRERVVEKLAWFEEEIEKNDGWRPNEYAELEKASIKALTQDQKLEVIDLLVTTFTDMTGLPLSYVVRDPESREPNGYIIYKKPEVIDS